MRSLSKLLFLNSVFFSLSFLPALVGQPDSNIDLDSKTLSRLNLTAYPIINDFLVNDDSGSTEQRLPAIAVNSSGKFAITWEDCRTDGAADIYAKMYDSLGVQLDTSFKVNDDTIGSWDFPDIAEGGSGTFITVWEDHRYGWNIYAQVFDSLGTPLDSNFRVNEDIGFPYQWFPAIASGGSGNFVITWTDDRTDPLGDIYAQMYESPATPLGTNFRVNDDTGSAYQWWPAIAMDVSGKFIITWEDRRNGSEDPDIYARRYNSSGTPSDDSAFKVNDDTGCPQYSPATAMNASGNFVVAWKDYRAHSQGDIYAQLYDSLGSRVGTNFTVNDDTGTVYSWCPAIAMDVSGKFVITWEDQRDGNPKVYAQKYDSGGNAEGKNYLVPDSPYDSSSQQHPAVATSGDRIYFTWQDNRRGRGLDIYAKVVPWTWYDEVEENDVVNLPVAFELFQNYPNPFNPTTKIEFTLAKSGFVTLAIYDILGRKVRTLASEHLSPGHKSVLWDGRNEQGKQVASGIYFYRIETSQFSQTKKMLLLK